MPRTPELAALQWLNTDTMASSLTSKWQESAVSRDTLAFLQYTSGSTGTPKGVMVSHGNLLHNLELIHQATDTLPNSRLVSWLPVYHDMGLITGILQPVYNDFPVTLMSPVAFLQHPRRWLQAISRFGATHSGGPNFAYDLCVRKINQEQRKKLDLSSWEVAFNGAEPVHLETLERFAAAFEPCGFRREAFLACYGLAEVTVGVCWSSKASFPIVYTAQKAPLEQKRVIAASVDDEHTKSLIGCGKAPMDQKIIVVDPRSATRSPPDQVGEIWVSGPSVTQGYWNRPAQTEQTFNAYLADTGEGPFLRCGDLGFLKDGELFVTGRLKDLIIIHGRNHSPQDIELTVEQSHSALRSGCSAAFLVEVEGKERLVVCGEVKRTFIRKLHLEGTRHEVVRAIRKAVSEQHGLKVYAVLLLKTASIPKTSSGKIQRHACRAGFLAGTLKVIEQ